MDSTVKLDAKQCAIHLIESRGNFVTRTDDELRTMTEALYFHRKPDDASWDEVSF